MENAGTPYGAEGTHHKYHHLPHTPPRLLPLYLWPSAPHHLRGEALQRLQGVVEVLGHLQGVRPVHLRPRGMARTSEARCAYKHPYTVWVAHTGSWVQGIQAGMPPPSSCIGEPYTRMHMTHTHLDVGQVAEGEVVHGHGQREQAPQGREERQVAGRGGRGGGRRRT